MKCQSCEGGETDAGITTLIFERFQTTVVFKDVPALV